MELKYPKQTDAYKTDKYTFSMDAEFYPVTGDKETDTPLHIYNDFSRVAVTMIERATKKVLTANISVDEMEDIKEMLNIARTKLVESKICSSQSGQETRIAYTVRISSGNLKGKTPAEILLAGQIDPLLNQRKWLADNVAKYAANQQQIDAIDEAIRLNDTGKLESTTASTTFVFPIYEGESKFKRTTNEKGHNLIYSCNILFDSSRNYPITIELSNCYAPVLTNTNGSKNIKMSESYSHDKLTVSMKLSKFAGMLDTVIRAMSAFELSYGNAMWKMAIAHSFKPNSDYNSKSKDSPQSSVDTGKETSKPSAVTNSSSNSEVVTIAISTTGPIIPVKDMQLVPVIDLETQKAGKLYFNAEKVTQLDKTGFWKRLIEMASSGVQLKIRAEKKGDNYLFLSSAC